MAGGGLRSACSGLLIPDTVLGGKVTAEERCLMINRRTFTSEFKLEAVRLVLEQRYTVLQACKSLGIGETSLRRWIDQVLAEQGGRVPQGKALTPEQQKIQELEARIHRLEREKAILKKATALLMSEEIERSR